MLPETIECVIAELDSAIHSENKPTQPAIQKQHQYH
jgi:hypothetical protein